MLRSIDKKGAVSLAACILATVGIAGQRVSVPPAAPGTFGAGANWSTYLGDAARTHYSRLTQIDKTNVARLRLAWSYDTGDRGEFQANNLVVDGVLYHCVADEKSHRVERRDGPGDVEVRSHHRAAGRQRQPAAGSDVLGQRVGGEAPHLHGRRATISTRWIAGPGQADSQLCGRTVRFSWARAPSSRRRAPPTVTAQHPGPHLQRHVYRRAASRTARQRSRLRRTHRRVAMDLSHHSATRRVRLRYVAADGYQTRAARRPTGRGAALDDARGIVYVPTESATPDFWGGDRPGANLFANSLLALDANTGKRLWHFQIMHHDLLDKDLPTPPVLLTVTQNGRRIDAVAQGTKHGLLFVFDRVTGEPLWPIEERPVPQTDLPGEQTLADAAVSDEARRRSCGRPTRRRTRRTSRRQARCDDAARFKVGGSSRRISSTEPQGNDHLSRLRRRHGMGRRRRRSRRHLLRERERDSLALSDDSDAAAGRRAAVARRAHATSMQCASCHGTRSARRRGEWLSGRCSASRDRRTQRAGTRSRREGRRQDAVLQPRSRKDSAARWSTSCSVSNSRRPPTRRRAGGGRWRRGGRGRADAPAVRVHGIPPHCRWRKAIRPSDRHGAR